MTAGRDGRYHRLHREFAGGSPLQQGKTQRQRRSLGGLFKARGMRMGAFEKLPQVAEKSLHIGVLMDEANEAPVGAQHEYVETVGAQQAKNLQRAGFV